ncbi:hypothetical protein C2S51_036321 [Perilla frutescens var. frutescens]|nr:hypothetical protein C2S51_036321 [Perilla frutescens var. frutescens]
MANSWFLLLAVISALAFISKTIFKQKPQKHLPPGPNPWPIIGNLNLIAFDPRRSIQSLCEKYGDIMLLKFGKFPVVIASSSEMARQFLKVNDAIFASRPALAAGKFTGYDYKNMAWAPHGPHWIQARKIYHMEVFSDKKMESFEHIRVEERRGLVSRLCSLSGKTIMLKDHLSKYTLSIICRMLISKKYFVESEHENSTSKHLESMVEELLDLNGAFNIGDWIPWLSFLDLQGYVQKMKALQKKLDKFYDYVIDDHEARRAEEKDFNPKDLVDVLLQLAEDPNLEVKITRDRIKGLIQDIFNGGIDSTANAIEWAIRETLKHPHIAKKAKAELDKVIGRKRWVEEKDLTQLPYIDAIVMETLRLHPLATFLTYHYSIEDSKVAGYDMPKGTTVLINIWSIARDPKTWDSPNEFLPERFSGKEVDVLFGSNFTLLPFGSGRRRCPGLSFGLKVLRITLANLLHGFNLKLGEGIRVKDVCLEDMGTAITRPKVPLAVVVEPTLPHDLY